MEKRRFLILFLTMALTIGFGSLPAVAEQLVVFGKPLNLFGYATQSGSFGLRDSYFSEKGLNSALMNLYVEGGYSPSATLKFYVSGMGTVDWAYQLNANRDDWNDKLLAKSRGHLNVDGKYWQVLKEAHVTWSPENFMLRIGKQVVAWGETDGFRLMDQINPLDQRRGFADVEFETTITPIWLVRAEYSVPVKPTWLKELGLEFVYNPNADFIPNQSISTGTADGGIWAPNIHLGIGSDLATTYFLTFPNPKRWKEGNEFAFRIRGVVMDTVITLNAFYGRDNDYVARLIPPFASPVLPNIFASDGNLLLHLFEEAKYPLFRFVGATFSKDITPLRASFLGGVSPVVRLETFYAFDNTFTFQNNLSPFPDQKFKKSDEFRGAIGVDWKVKIPLLNARSYFTISPQFYYRRIMDYPSLEESPAPLFLKKNNYITSLMINTSYLHNKLNPSFFWLRDIDSKSDFFRLQLVYDYSNNWHFTLGASLFDGKKEGYGFNSFNEKNMIYFKVAYKWG